MFEKQRFRQYVGRSADRVRLQVSQISTWELLKQPSSIAPPDVWTNADMDPVPPERRTWGRSFFFTYWVSDLVTISTWALGSAIITLGLTATDAVLITLVAGICNAIPTVLNGAIGADLHIPFPIASRASHGYWFSYFAVISRGIIAMFWFGVHTGYGGTCVSTMLTAIWPSFATLPNHLPASAGLTTAGMISYFLFWLIQFPLLLIPTHKLQYVFWVKTVLMQPVAIDMMIWVAMKAGGNGAFFNEPSQAHGSERVWLWFSSMTGITGGYSTLAVNIPDVSRFSKNRHAHYWQIPTIPLLKTLTDLMGIISSSAAQHIWGTLYWTPIQIIDKWQGTSSGRAAAFFCAAIWLLSQVSVNVSANAVSFANDVTSLAPKWFNVRRGTIIVSLLGSWALCPLIIMASGKAFLNFMSAYAIFMAPIAGIHLASVLQRMFTIDWLYGFFLSITLYYTLNLVFPDKESLVSKTITGFEIVGDDMVDETPSITSNEGVESRKALESKSVKVSAA